MIATAHEDQEISNLLIAWRDAKLKDFDDASLAWLAVVPCWTERLAELTEFPSGSSSLTSFLKQAEDAHICERETRDREAESAQQSAQTLAAIWPRLDEEQRRKLAPALSNRVRAMPASFDQKRILRYIQPYLSATEGSSFLSRVRSSLGGEPEPNRALDLLVKYLGGLGDRSPSPHDLGALVPATLQLRGPEFLETALKALSQIRDPEVALRALAPLAATLPESSMIIEFARGLADKLTSPEMRAQLLLHVASYAKGDLKQTLQTLAIEIADQIEDPTSRAFALLNVGVDLAKHLRDEVSSKLLEITRQISEAPLRARILTSTLPFLKPSEIIGAGSEAAEIASNLADPAERIGLLVPIVRAFAATGEKDRARDLAASETDPAGRARLLLEILPHMGEEDSSPLLASITLTIDSLDSASLEDLLSTVSPEAGAALAKTDTKRISTAARAAASARRFAPAARIAALLPPRGRTKLFSELLDLIRVNPILPARLEGITQISPYLPNKLLEGAALIAIDISSSKRFWVCDSAKPDLIEHLNRRKGPKFLTDAVIATGKGILEACQKESLDIAAATWRWSQIATRCANVPQAAAFLAEQIRTAVASGDTTEALEILNLATPLARIVGAELEPAVVLGKHRIQIAFRRAADERHLACYLPRKEQIEAFDELLLEPDGANTHWALHYLGMGGVGKTMLLRHIVAHLAIKNGEKLPTTRVDFDHISPDYPARKPGELLAAMAEELRFYGTSLESRFNDFTSHLIAVHRALSNEPPPDDPLQNIQSDSFGLLLDKFAALLMDLPKPVILILDTCEELAKLEPAGTMLPSVEATFKILEELHRRVPQIRVVFAGRRLLARAGCRESDNQCRWKAEPGSLSERNKLLPSEKDFLRLHVVRGFTGKEAEDYFDRIVQLDIDSERRKAILKASPDAGAPPGIEWRGVPPAGNDDTPRYNPFDLFLYTDWIREDKNITAETIGSGETDPYVEVRIVQRIADEAVRQALPAAVLLRRFDIEMLRDVVTGGDEALKRVYRDLGAQEWIDFQQGVLQVDTNLLPRLERYYGRERRQHLLARARDALQPALASFLKTALEAPDPFSVLTVANVDAALRLLPAPDAAVLWDQIDRRVTMFGNWSWADNVCAYLLNENNAAGSESSPLRAAVRATMAGVALHNPPYEPVLRWWLEVESKAGYHPDLAIGAWLRVRASLVMHPVTAAHVALIRGMHPDHWRYEQTVAGFAASLERLSDSGNDALPESDFAFDESVPIEVRAFIACLYSRHATSSRIIAHAKTLAKSISAVNPQHHWADWRGTACVSDRVRLELLREKVSGTEANEADAGGSETSRPVTRRNATPKELKEWSRDAAQRLRNIDSERLLSRLIQIALAHNIRTLPKLPTEQLYDLDRRPVFPAHREVPPLFASVAEALLVKGKARDAISVVSNVMEIARSRQDTEAMAAGRLLELQIARRMRWPNALSSANELIGIQQPQSSPFHRWWATQPVLSNDDTTKLLDSVERQGPGIFRRLDNSVDAFSILDAFEADLLAKRIGRVSHYTKGMKLSDDPLLKHLSPSESIRWRLRISALFESAKRSMPVARDQRRNAAEIALEEAELLALRLGTKSDWMFQWAAKAFMTANDSFGALRAVLGPALISPYVDAKQLSQTLATARDLYDKCRAEVNDLPGWAEIRPVIFARFKDHPWFDWLLRIARLKAMSLHQVNFTNDVNRAIAERYGSQHQFDLRVIPVTEKPTVLQETIRAWPSLLLGLVLLALIISAVVFGGSWLWRHPQVTAIAGIALLEILVVAWITFRWILPGLSRVIFKISRPRLLVQAGQPTGQVAIRFEADRPKPTFLQFLKAFQIDPEKGESEPLAQPSFQKYSEVASSFATRLHPLKRIGMRFGARVPIALIVDQTLEHYPWEAPFSIAARSRLKLDSFDFIRFSHAIHEPTGLIEWTRGMVYVICRSGLGDMVERAWGRMDRPIHVNLAGAALPLVVDPVRVIHLVGNSTVTRSGPTFSTELPTGESAPTPISLSTFPVDPAIVIVQEEPVERIYRLDVDREQTSNTRRWAAKLFRDGSLQTVILIPALPLALARETVEILARGLRGSTPPDMFNLLEVVAKARRSIMKFRPAKSSLDLVDLRAGMEKAEFKTALRELSLELTVFSRPKPSEAPDSEYTGFMTT